MAPKKRSKLKKILIGLIVLVVVGGIVALNLRRGKKVEQVETVRVKKGIVTDKLTETGTIELVRTVEIKSTISGRIKDLLVEEGEVVEEGQLLAVIEPDPNQTLLLYGKRSQVDRALIDLEQNKKVLERRRELFKRNLISKEDMEEAENLFNIARNRYELAKMELEIVETKANIAVSDLSSGGDQPLDDVQVLAPIAGVVVNRNLEIGEVVVSGISSAIPGTKIFEIGDPSQMIVKAQISEVDVGKMRPGQSVEIVADAYPDTTYYGRVLRIAPVGSIKQGSPIVTFDTEIEILDKEPRLRPGMSCDIDIIYDRHEDALYLPVEAVFEVFDEEEEKTKGKRGEFLAYLKSDGEFDEVGIRIGLESTNRLEIIEGLKLDDEVAADAEKMREKKERERKEEEEKKEGEAEAEKKEGGEDESP